MEPQIITKIVTIGLGLAAVAALAALIYFSGDIHGGNQVKISDAISNEKTVITAEEKKDEIRNNPADVNALHIRFLITFNFSIWRRLNPFLNINTIC
jgi:hypothetical protein